MLMVALIDPIIHFDAEVNIVVNVFLRKFEDTSEYIFDIGFESFVELEISVESEKSTRTSNSSNLEA
jgi:hypothetical protein